ncbi:putative acyltransferase [Tripterygium wilfordii]|uniref:3-ketoacyl-CoA synthase n=1 Tax=Tripterygium wilfordii TaxID=458696 RepID=A0A7J7CGZ7_TRIWF|nr:3-ketoacyl-CoA synthase 7 [Tripterygium wilfordii]KAF5733317.1 putative acyltransferase [Tripterygium wilfordii]
MINSKLLAMATDMITNISLPTTSTITEDPISFIYICAATALIVTVLYFIFISNTVYLIDFTCYLPPDHLRAPLSTFMEHFHDSNQFGEETLNFIEKVLERSGVGGESCLPISVHEIPPASSLNRSQEETEEILFTVVDHLLSKHKINPKSIDILVSNCSIFCPTPSITAMVINRFGFRSNIKSISLSGMGCSAGILSISLVKDLLKVHKNSLALVLSMEAISPNGYRGTVKSMLIPNTLFRMGGAAIILSNRKQDKQKAKYKLQHLIRTHLGSDDQAHCSVIEQADQDGNVGVSLSKALLHVAARALRTNMTELGPLVLPYSEQIQYVWSLIRRGIWSSASKKEYVPNFKKAFEHFCIHAGGRAVIDAVEENLRLHEEDGEASRMTLYRFGNTSSSSIWYELSYLEAKGRVKKGNRVWQIAFGSGFKCNSAVWKCVSSFHSNVGNVWSDRIHLYPVKIPSVADH